MHETASVRESGFFAERQLRFKLQEDLVTRCEKNPKYSLRAYARFLGVEPSALSKILSGKRTITESMYRRLSERLGIVLPPSSLEFTSNDARSAANYEQLALDSFRFISDWYHFALLELMNIKDHASDSRKMARAIGISNVEVSAALERMERLSLIHRREDGRWESVETHRSVLGDDLKTAAQRKLQKQVLEKAIRAIEEVPSEARDNTSMTMAIAPHKIPEAKKRITKFRRELCQFLEDGPKGEVYNLVVSLYPLTQIGSRT